MCGLCGVKEPGYIRIGALEPRLRADRTREMLRRALTNPLSTGYSIFTNRGVSLNAEVGPARPRSLTRLAAGANAAGEVTMNPQTLHLDLLWLVPPMLAVAFMAWVLWCWWQEAHKHRPEQTGLTQAGFDRAGLDGPRRLGYTGLSRVRDGFADPQAASSNVPDWRS